MVTSRTKRLAKGLSVGCISVMIISAFLFASTFILFIASIQIDPARSRISLEDAYLKANITLPFEFINEQPVFVQDFKLSLNNRDILRYTNIDYGTCINSGLNWSIVVENLTILDLQNVGNFSNILQVGNPVMSDFSLTSYTWDNVSGEGVFSIPVHIQGTNLFSFNFVHLFLEDQEILRVPPIPSGQCFDTLVNIMVVGKKITISPAIIDLMLGYNLSEGYFWENGSEVNLERTFPVFDLLFAQPVNMSIQTENLTESDLRLLAESLRWEVPELVVKNPAGEFGLNLSFTIRNDGLTKINETQIDLIWENASGKYEFNLLEIPELLPGAEVEYVFQIGAENLSQYLDLAKISTYLLRTFKLESPIISIESASCILDIQMPAQLANKGIALIDDLNISVFLQRLNDTRIFPVIFPARINPYTAINSTARISFTLNNLGDILELLSFLEVVDQICININLRVGPVPVMIRCKWEEMPIGIGTMF